MATFAKTFDVDISTGKPAASNEAYYHGETVEFRAVRGREAVTNIEYAAVYYQTNGMGDVWWKTDGLVFHPTNDTGAASYRFFLEGRDGPGRDWHANGLLRLLPSPGFTPNVLQPPVATLDFANIEVFNAPWPGEIAEAADALALEVEAAKAYARVAVGRAEDAYDCADWAAKTAVEQAESNRTAIAAEHTYTTNAVQEARQFAWGLYQGARELIGALDEDLGCVSATNTMQSAAIASNETTLASHSSQLSQLSQSLANKLDKTGEQTLDGSLTATGFLNAPSINFPGSSAYIDASDDTIVFHSTQKPSGSPFGGQVIEESPLKPDGTAVVTQLGLLPLTETNAAQDAHLATVDGRLDSLDSQISGKADAVKQAVLADTWTGTVWGAIAVCLTNRYDGVWAGTATNPAGFPLDAHLECSGSDGDYEWELAIPEFALTSQGRTDAIPGDGETLTLDDGSLIRHFEYSSSPVVYEDALAEAASDSVRAIESATNSLAAAVADTYQPKGSYLTSETDPTAISAVSNVMTAAGVETDYLAQWRGSSVRGGVRIRYSSRNEDNLTAYLYNGVAVRRNGTTDDFLFGTTNQYGVVRFRDLEPIITSICLSLIGNVYWQSDDNGRTMDAYYRDAETISNIVSTAVAYIAETRATAFIRIEPDGAAGVYQPDAEEMGGVADRAATRQREGADDE